MNLQVQFAESGRSFAMQMEKTEQSMDVDFGQIHTVTKYVGGEPYEGDYVVTPKMEEQIMPTKEKVMLEDVTIRAIPVYRVSNTSGGTTVYIANEV